MQKGNNHLSKKLLQLEALLLAFLFLSITALQLLHTHADHGVEQRFSKSNIEQVVEQCKVCEHYLHTELKTQPIQYAVVFHSPIPLPAKPSIYYFIGNYKFTLQGFTNKGPPIYVG